MPRKNPIGEQEAEICRRLGKFRKWTGFSQAEFSCLADLNHRAYVNYEYGRSQLNYAAARSVFEAHPWLNPTWLAEGKGAMLDGRDFDYPDAKALGIGPRVSFRQVYFAELRARLLHSPVMHLLRPVKGLQVFTAATDLQGRLLSKERFGSFLSGWLAALPDSRVNDFLNALFRRAAQVVARYPRDKDRKAIERRRGEIYRIEKSRRFGPSGQKHKGYLLTESESAAKLPPVKSQLEKLLADLNRLTEEQGKKTELADFLGAPLASVSRWLSGEREPGGETTLKMLRWVEHQERHTKESPAAAQTATGQKTQVRKSKAYEKANSNRKKQ